MTARIRALTAALALSVASGSLAPSGACDSEPVVVDPCDSIQCISGPGPRCDGQVKVSFEALGECVVTEGLATCTYPELAPQDCAQLGKICQAGQCITPPIIPCEGVTCQDPPAPDCNGEIAQIYVTEGRCDPTIPPAGACVYAVEASLDCAANDRECRGGGCIDPADFPCDPNPCDVPPLGTCNGASPVSFVSPGTCTEEAGAAHCAYAQQAANPCPGGTCEAGACATGLAAPAAAGDLVISELLRNPAGEDDLGEWIELYNPQSVARSLDGCTLSDEGSDSYTFPAEGGLVIPAKGWIVLGRSGEAAESGGLVPDAVYSDFILSNSADEVIIECGGVVIDRVAYTDTGWPFEVAAAMSLAPSALTAGANDAPTAWCDAITPYGDRTNLGTPRAANPPCP